MPGVRLLSTIMRHNVLVPVDFTQDLATTLDVARDVGINLQAHLTLLHVLQPDFSQAAADSELRLANKGAMRAKLVDAACELHHLSDLLHLSGIETSVEIVVGNLNESIATSAQRSHADMILINPVIASATR